MNYTNKTILALDVGTVRIGTALKKSGTSIIFPWGLIDAKKSSIEKIVEILKENNVDEIVIGLPTLLKGGAGKQTESVKKWAETFAQTVKIPITFVDERLTTKLAKRTRSEFSASLDEMAAIEILKTYVGEF